MVTEAELLTAVDEAFAATGRGLAVWPDPHADGPPRREEYSRITAPGRWRIVAARADAWASALGDTGLAVVERDATIRWAGPRWVDVPGTRVVPHAPGALPLVVAGRLLDGVADAGATLGMSDPAVHVGTAPDCGCDACDRGAQEELDRLDLMALAVVRGTFRHFTHGDREMASLGTSGGAPPPPGPGWREVSGRPWLQAGAGPVRWRGRP